MRYLSTTPLRSLLHRRSDSLMAKLLFGCSGQLGAGYLFGDRQSLGIAKPFTPICGSIPAAIQRTRTGAAFSAISGALPGVILNAILDVIHVWLITLIPVDRPIPRGRSRLHSLALT
jgi:hypothetical protein